MSDKPKLLTGTVVKNGSKLFSGKTFFIVLGVIMFLASGMFRTTIFAVKDMADQGKPYFNEASAALKAVNPGFPEMVFTMNGNDIVLSKGMAPGQDYIELMGESYSPGSSSSGSSSRDDDGGSTAADDLPAQAPPAEEDPAVTFARYNEQYIALVGGIPDIPDFSLLTHTNIKTARQLIANIKSLNVDLVLPSTWNDSMEAEVEQLYEDCFTDRDLECVKDWDKVQINSVEPLELESWIISMMPDTTEIAKLMKVATHVDVESVVNGVIEKSFVLAVIERKQVGCDALGVAEPSANGTALDLQWCLSGRTAKVWIEEQNTLNNFWWDEVGGGMGELGNNDYVAFIVEEKVEYYRVTAAVAMTAVDGLDFEGHNNYVEFPGTPVLWNAESNPWSPGQLITP